MTEEELVHIESLTKQRMHVFPPDEQWSAAMTKAMLDKIPELVTEVRKLSLEKEDMAKQLEGILKRMKA